MIRLLCCVCYDEIKQNVFFLIITKIPKNICSNKKKLNVAFKTYFKTQISTIEKMSSVRQRRGRTDVAIFTVNLVAFLN